ncbi:TRAP transporter small permease [Metasolibacillus sp. FSL K6-0083]|uniref:TRAP transporter small permease n=1 Tax=Metasolibacillus sp. FSL K6-0083 TaxID=2921416 RepID=UPI003159B1DF
MKIISVISDALYKMERILAVILMATMLCSIALGVAFRYIFDNPLTWSDELAIYMLIWLTFVGGSMSIKTMRASSLELVFDRLSIGWQRTFIIVGYATVIIFAGIVAYMAIQWLTNPSIKTQISPGLKISMFLPYLAVPFGLVCLLIHAFNHLIKGFSYTSNKSIDSGGGEAE